jgi:hypothetical protein
VLLYSRGYFVCERRGAAIPGCVNHHGMSSYSNDGRKKGVYVYIYIQKSVYSITLFEQKKA